MSESMKKPQMKDETRKKVDNFWYYYKFHVLIGAFLLFMVIVFIKDMLGKVDYDYNIAFVTDYMIADEDSQALQGYFEANAEDLNGDGEVHVQIQNYVLPPDDAQGYDPPDAGGRPDENDSGYAGRNQHDILYQPAEF